MSIPEYLLWDLLVVAEARSLWDGSVGGSLEYEYFRPMRLQGGLLFHVPQPIVVYTVDAF